jgi:hypothetical protein
MNDFAGPGHNRPPEPMIDRAFALVGTASRWIAERPTIDDRETAGRAQDFVSQLRAGKADLEAEWKAARKPHDEAIAALRTRYRDPLDMVVIALFRMGEKLAPWLQAERDRLADEAEQQRAAAVEAAAHAELARQKAASGNIEAELAARHADEAAQRAAKLAAKPTPRARIKGDLSAKAMSLREHWRAEVTDAAAALDFFGQRPEVKAAALEAATRLASAMARELKNEAKAPPGYRFVKSELPV